MQRLTAGVLVFALLSAGCAGSRHVHGEGLDGFRGSLAADFVGARVVVRTAGGEIEGILEAVRDSAGVLEVRPPGDAFDDAPIVAVPLAEVESLEFPNEGPREAVFVAVLIVVVGLLWSFGQALSSLGSLS